MSPEEEARFMRRYHLGALVEASSNMEFTLRSIVATLLGSPRAAVVAAGQSVTWLVDNALAVIDANEEVRAPSLGKPEKVARFRAAIKNCGELNARRNLLIHGVWFEILPDGRPGLSVLRSRWRRPHLYREGTTLEEVEDLARELAEAAYELLDASVQVDGIIIGPKSDSADLG